MERLGCFTLFISLFWLIGLGLLGYGLWQAWQSTRARGWPVAEGIIRQADLKSSTDSEGSTTYQVEVEYEYAVDGVLHRSSVLAFGYSSSSGREAHAEILDKLKQARTVEVRYNPANPGQAVLSHGLHRSIQLMLTFGVTWLAFVGGFTLLWWLISTSDRVLLDNLMVR